MSTSCVAQSKPLCLQSKGCVWTPDFFSAHTENAQLADRKEIFAEFDKKCIGLELQITPLNTKSI